MKILILVALLTGCATNPTFKPTLHNKKMTVNFEVGKDMKKLFGKGKAAYTICLKTGQSVDCIVWVPEIKELTPYILCLWGEEAAHLYYGEFHEKGAVSICEEIRR